MTSRGRLFTVLGLLGFVGFLAWSTLAAQKTECFVKVTFNGHTDSATASASTEEEATRQAQTTACGPMAGGMNETIACGRTRPITVRCHKL